MNYVYFNFDSGSVQDLMFSNYVDPQNFKVDVKVEFGNLKISKTSEDEIIKNIPFTVKGNGKTYNVTTDANGNAELKNIPVGTYQVYEGEILRYVKQATKTVKSDTLFWGMGHWTRANAEFCILATKGHPKRKSARVHQVIISRIEEHSKKPDEARKRIIELARLLNISDAELDYITNAEAGHGLIKIGRSLVPFENDFPKNTKLYKLMSTKPGEKEGMAA